MALAPRTGVVTCSVGFVTVKLRDDDKMPMLLRDGYEPETREAWRRACADGRAQTAIDVGAYAGLFAISAALMGNHSIAIEGKQIIFERMLKNIAMNRIEVTAIHAAAASEDGMAEFWVNGSDKSVASSLQKAGTLNRTERVRTIRLDTLASEGEVKGKVGAIKIDVEGTEADVIAGALGIINRDRPVLLVETLIDDGRQQQVRELLPDYECVGFLDGRNLHMVPR